MLQECFDKRLRSFAADAIGRHYKSQHAVMLVDLMCQINVWVRCGEISICEAEGLFRHTRDMVGDYLSVETHLPNGIGTSCLDPRLIDADYYDWMRRVTGFDDGHLKKPAMVRHPCKERLKSWEDQRCVTSRWRSDGGWV